MLSGLQRLPGEVETGWPETLGQQRIRGGMLGSCLHVAHSVNRVVMRLPEAKGCHSSCTVLYGLPVFAPPALVHNG